MPSSDPEFEVSSPPQNPPPASEPEPRADAESVEEGADKSGAAPPATKPEKAVEYAGGLPPAELSRDQLDELQAAQARHAQHLAIDDLSRRYPAVRLLVEENSALRDRVAEFEKGAKKKVR